VFEIKMTSLKIKFDWGFVSFNKTYLSPQSLGFGALRGHLFKPSAKARDGGLLQTTLLDKICPEGIN